MERRFSKYVLAGPFLSRVVSKLNDTTKQLVLSMACLCGILSLIWRPKLELGTFWRLDVGKKISECANPAPLLFYHRSAKVHRERKVDCYNQDSSSSLA